jgi:Coenzyme PQQ synthesis protein D (PqqD)
MQLARRIRSVFGRRSNEPCIPCGQQKGVRQFSLNPAPPVVIGDQLRPRLTPGRQFAVVDGQLVLYDPVGIVSHVLNPSAAAVWAAVDGRRTVLEIVDTLEADIGVDRDVLDRDVRQTLARLLDSRIVTLEPEPEPEPDAGPSPARGSGADEPSVTRWTEVIHRILDRVSWPTVIGPVLASGRAIVVRTNVAVLSGPLEGALAALPPLGPHPNLAGEPAVVSLYDAGPARPRRFRLYVGGRERGSDADASTLVEGALREITQIAAAESAGRLFFHAGAVERDGTVVALTGQSGRGKSTLTAALVQRGFAYVTDELVSVDPRTFDVLSYPKAIDLDATSCRMLGLAARPEGPDDLRLRSPVPVREIGTSSAGGRLGLVVFLDEEIRDVDPGATSSSVRSVLDLIAVTFGSTFADELALEMLAGVAGSVPCIRVDRGPLEQMCGQIESAAGLHP